ncbi:xaa-Pro dipeptidase-like [Zingiber officinale]|uniref:xaa-Pro dipeptidase-like n=1 Tax=Zingiber officinale TaxID=94328 RepID=UPI001C4C9017|nr:xaa-Pro dipeptidase-like [Zingiber officinale]
MASCATVLSPPEVPMELHALNRDKLVQAMRDNLAASSRPVRGFVVLQGGEEQTRYCSDHALLFRQESYFAYLFGVREPGFFGAIDVASGKSILFAPRLPDDYAVWLGEIKPPSVFKERYMVDMVFYVDELVQVLHSQSDKQGKPLLFLLYGLNTDSNNFSKPAEIEDIEKFDTDLSTLHPILTECRVIKSKMELDIIQYANDVSSEAHIEVMRQARVGMKEYQLESIFLHHVYMYGGCRHCSYTCICATGENSAVLHYGHASAPNDRTLEDGDIALFDMGAEYHFYGSDITCSFPVNGKFTKDQATIYNAVLAAHNAVIESMRPGVCWIDMHELAEKTILESLKNRGIVLGDIDKMMELRLGAIFMPHGLGHLLGIDTHDPGGYAQGLERPKEPGLKALRTIRKLQEGMVITVEPGCYFIDALLIPAMEDTVKSKFLNREEIAKYRKFGGVRIESDVLVTADGSRNFTNCPRQTWEIEAVMAGAPWPVTRSSIKS